MVVIGGGSTGSAVVRDVAMRGFKAALVDRVDLAQGTTARFHGLLHSGGRYVKSDPESATECAEENAILRKVVPHAIEDTGGLFVTTSQDSEEHADVFWNVHKRPKCLPTRFLLPKLCDANRAWTRN